MKQLDDNQLKTFDMEYVDEQRWPPIAESIERDFPDGNFSFLDIGGGNGMFADLLLSKYPRARGTVLDNSKVLLEANKPHDRKTLIDKSAEHIDLIEEKYDVIFINWVLHHLVGDHYRSSRQHQLDTLHKAKSLLTNRGRISIYENNYRGWLIENLPGRMIFSLTASKLLSKFVGRMGANTAGVGVCFLSKSQWLETISRAGFQLQSFTEPDTWTWPIRWEWRMFLHLRSIHTGHYWISAN